MRLRSLLVLELFIPCFYGVLGQFETVRTLYGSSGSQSSNIKTFTINSDEDDYFDNQNHRSKRETAPAPSTDVKNSTVEVKINHLNDTHKQMMVHWVGEGSNVIICLARDPLFPNTFKLGDRPPNPFSPSSVFISYDYGDTYINKTDAFKLANGSYASLEKFFTHPKYNTHFVFADVHYNLIFVTTDHGKNIQRVELNFTPSEIQYHDYQPSVFAVLDRVDQTRKLWITEDFGRTFRVAQIFVKQFFWLEDEDGNFQLVVQRMEPSGLSLVMYSPLFETIMNEIYDINIQDFFQRDGYLFSTKKNSTDGKLELYMSYKFNDKLECVFETDKNISAYYIVDVTASRALVVAVHSSMVSNLYVSEDVGGVDGKVHFSLSLENVLAFYPNVTWRESWLEYASEEAFADVHKVDGLNGIYIASKVIRKPVGESIGPQHLASVISFDHGGSWRSIQAPAYDSESLVTNCQLENNCSLHLGQKFSHLYPDVRALGILSSKSAPGLIIATGVMGKHMKDGRHGVYVSSDGGVSWHQALRDLYYFNMGDHGGILTAAEYFTFSRTHLLKYSTDEGEKWKMTEFMTEDIKLYGLMTEPGENTTIFTMFGSAVNKHQWIIIKVDLKSVFSYNCTKDDYKTWSPGQNENRSYMPCVMGQQLTYQRRMPHSNCYNGNDYDMPISMQPCDCDYIDFECDFGFMRTGKPFHCIRNKSVAFDPYAIPATCKPGMFYNRTRGYRKIPGDVCVHQGFEKQYLPDVIPCPFKEAQQFLLYAQRERISRYDLITKVSEPLPIKNLKNVIAIDFDMKNNCVYWADIIKDTIGRQCLDNASLPEILVSTDLASIEGLALDWISHTLYFVDGTRAKIELIRTDVNRSGRMRRTIFDNQTLKKPRGIAVHPVEGYLYWTDWATEDPSINRANLDGTNVLKLFKKPTVQWPNGITVDHIANRIYWVDAREDYIASCDLHGDQMVKIISKSEVVAHPFAIAVFKDYMYWDDWKNNAIYAADKDGRLPGVEVLMSAVHGLMDLKIYAHSLQEGTNACANSTCDYICVGAPRGGHSCLCPDGMDFLNGKCLCPGGVAPYPNATCPKFGSTCSSEHITCKNGACIPKGWRCDGDNDCGDNSDELLCNTETCEPNFHTCDDGKCIPNYWRCDFEKDCSDGSDELNCPRQNCTAEMFQCTNGRCISKRWQCDMENDCGDGSDEENCQDPEPQQCKSMVDEFKCKSGNVLCIPSTWRCDGEKDCRDQSDEADCGQNKCLDSQFSCGPPSNRCIYSSWVCDGDRDCLSGLDEANCTVVPPKNNTLILPFEPQNGTCLSWMFTCANHRCIPKWWRCDHADDCLDGSDEFDCHDIAPSTPASQSTTPSSNVPYVPVICKHNEYHCLSGECINEAWVCDGSRDCKNGDDENNCKISNRCTEKEFRCQIDGSCIPTEGVCNGKVDCPDGSDERVCDVNLPDGPATSSCSIGYFPCDGHSCYPLASLCDGNKDCRDGFDEQNCSSANKTIYQVFRMDLDERHTNETAVALYWSSPANANLEFMPSISKVGENKWTNESWIESTEFLFTGLAPYTKYNITVYVRVNGTANVFPPAKYYIATTREGEPSPPYNITVHQRNGSHVFLSWNPPTYPSGVIKCYDIYWSPPSPPIKVEMNDNATSHMLPVVFEHGQTYSFYVVAHTSFYESKRSEIAKLVFDGDSNVDYISNLSAKETTNQSVTLAWDYGKQADLFAITIYTYPPYPALHMRYTKENKIVVDGLAPGAKYTFKVRAIRKSFEGPETTIYTQTAGTPLPTIDSLQVVLIKEPGTSVKLRWELPKDPRKVNWVYGIYYGTEEIQLYDSAHLNTTNLTATVSNLQACEQYMFSVGIVGPYGLGPVGTSATVMMFYNDKAPPKRLTVVPDDNDPLYILVKWSPSCMTARNSVGYIIKVHEKTLKKDAYFTFSNTTELVRKYKISYGAVYEISVSTDVVGAISSPVFTYTAPPILPPYELKVTPMRDGAFMVNWTEREIPKEIGQYKYEVLVSEGSEFNESTAQSFEVEKPPFIYKNSSGTTFTFAVQVKTARGYKSLLSETPSIAEFSRSVEHSTNSETNMTAILVPVLVLVVILLVILGVLVVRHRRLQNSFTRFANSHYDTRSGAATFDDNGLEEEDAPQIRGFSDDEPLVIA